MKVSDLTGAELDYWVAKAEGHAEIEVSSFTRGGEKRLRCEVVLPGKNGKTYWTEYQPSVDWSVAGPIIERERIEVSPCSPRNWGNVEHRWMALAYLPEPHVNADGPTLLIAAMRAYVASKYGDEVQEPL